MNPNRRAFFSFFGMLPAAPFLIKQTIDAPDRSLAPESDKHFTIRQVKKIKGEPRVIGAELRDDGSPIKLHFDDGVRTVPVETKVSFGVGNDGQLWIKQNNKWCQVVTK